MKHVTQALWEEVKDFSREDLQKKLKAKRRSDLDKIMSGSVEAQHERTVLVEEEKVKVFFAHSLSLFVSFFNRFNEK